MDDKAGQVHLSYAERAEIEEMSRRVAIVTLTVYLTLLPTHFSSLCESGERVKRRKTLHLNVCVLQSHLLQKSLVQLISSRSCLLCVKRGASFPSFPDSLSHEEESESRCGQER
jgi:hypothetical protein